MSEEKAKELAHELTIEYVKKRDRLLSDVETQIPKMVEDFAKINKQFYEEIIKNKTLDSLY